MDLVRVDRGRPEREQPTERIADHSQPPWKNALRQPCRHGGQRAPQPASAVVRRHAVRVPGPDHYVRVMAHRDTGERGCCLRRVLLARIHHQYPHAPRMLHSGD